MKHNRTLFGKVISLAVALFFPLVGVQGAMAQGVVNMQNGDSIVLDACSLGGGDIYDDGGLLSNYSNNFDGYVVIEAMPGMSITLSGSYSTESCCDHLWVHDGNTTLVDGAAGIGNINVTSTTGSLLFRFTSDGSSTSTGFELHWSVSGFDDNCPNPVTNLTATTVTTSSIGLSWTADNASGPFTILVDGQQKGTSSTTSYTLTDLNASTGYEVCVVATASLNSRCCASTVYLHTACGDVEMPFSEGFEGMAEGSFPDCWLQVVNFDDEESQPQVVATQHSKGQRSLLLSCGNTESSGHFGIVATPPVIGTEQHVLRLQLRSSHVSTVVEVGTCDSTGSEYNQYGFTTLQTLYLDNTDHWESYRIEWTPESDGQRLALRMQQSSQLGVGRRVYIDDVKLEDCGIDSLQAIHVEHDRLQLRWVTFGNPVCNVGVRREGAVDDTLSFNAVSSPLDITGLSPETRYVFTVYPVCGGNACLSGSVIARTAIQPTSADSYCSQFSQNTQLPQEWTFTTVHSSCDAHFDMYDRGVYFHDGCSGAEGIMASERLLGLAGKQIAITYSGDNNGARFIIGTMEHADDPLTFVPLDTAFSDGLRHTVVVNVPTASLGRHIAVRMINPSWYISFYIHSVRCGKHHVDDDRLLHRRGTTSVFSWAEDYDTVLVQHGPRDFVLGTGIIDTFYHTSRATVRNLTQQSEIDYFIYRPAQLPCEDQRLRTHTAVNDYPLPYCENFDTLTSDMWYVHTGDWGRHNDLEGTPCLSGQFADYSGDALQMASWGFNWGYYATAQLPDVEVDSNTLLSIYVHDLAPHSNLLVGVIPEGANSDYFQVLDTLRINSSVKRRHYVYPLRPSDTLLNARLALRYMHPYAYSNYSVFIDEVSLGHQAYGNLSVIHTGYDTVCFSLDSLWGTDSLELILMNSEDTVRRSFGRSQMGAMGIGGLDTGAFFVVYVRTKEEGCMSMANYFSLVGGSGYAYCFKFDDNALPNEWAATDGAAVTTDGELALAANAAAAVHPSTGFSGLTYSFYARGRSAGDTLLLGTLPASSIHRDSSHFVLNPSLFSAIDTFVVDTTDGFFMVELPELGDDTLRACMWARGDSIWLDEVGFLGCPIVNFDVKGNRVICSQDHFMPYYLTIDDSAGTDHRVVFVNRNPYVLEGIHLDTRYTVSWECLYRATECHPMVTFRTGSTIPLPYCEDFNVGVGSVNIPPVWKFVSATGDQSPSLDTWGPSLVMNPYDHRWMYAVLPKFEADSVMSLQANIYSWESGSVQIGVLMSGTDTASFLPLWVPDMGGELRPNIDVSAYCDKHLAIRTKSDMRLFFIHIYNIPRVVTRLTGYRQLTMFSDKEAPYWLNYARQWTDYDTIIGVKDSVYVLNETVTDHVRSVPTCDSLGTTCDGYRDYYLGVGHSLPDCYDPNATTYPWDRFQYHSRYRWGEIRWIRPNNFGPRHMRFYGNASVWNVGPDYPALDSIKHLGMRIEYSAASELDSLEVGVLFDAYDTLTFTPIDTLVFTATGDSAQTAFIDFSRYTGNGRWVALHHMQREGAEWFDIRRIYADACPASMGAEASLWRWNRVKIDGPHTPFYMEYYQQGSSWQGNPENTVVRVDSVPMILILEPETTFEFYFRCDSAGTTCVPPQLVTTLAAPLEVPTCVDFDTVLAGTLPRSWRARSPEIVATNQQSYSDTNSLKMPIGTTSYVITPDINVDSIKDIALSLRFRVEDLSDRLVVGVMSNPADLSTFYPVRTLTPGAVGTWQYGLVEFDNAPQDAHFIALRTRSNHQAGGRTLWVDNFYVTDCAASDFTVQSLTNNAIDLAWNQVGSPEITVTVMDNDTVAQVFTNPVPPLHIEPLNTLHYYTFLFSSHCDDGSNNICTVDYLDTLSVVTPAPGTGCVNPTDLASPQAVFFSGSYKNPYARAGAINYGSLHPDSRHTVCYDTAQRDPRTGNLLRTIPEGYTSSVRLGNWSSNYFSPEAEGVIYSLFVDTTSFELLLLRYAAVMQDPMHAPDDQPRFRMELLDTNYNLIDSACTSADFIADQSLGWNMASDGVLWKDWTSVGIDLTPYAERQVFVRLTTYDCNEGSHYGYAYFTLECRRKNLNTDVCGAVDTITLTAPEGFHYRWYSSESNSTISTEATLTMPTNDITYYCDISKLDNPACNFTISSYGGTRYPMAIFDTTNVQIDSCRFFVDFTNMSGISKDGVELVPGESCQTAYWDFGNGTGASTYHASTVYNAPGTYIVRLVSGISLDACTDTALMTLNLVLPAGAAPTDTTLASICDNEQYTFYGQNYNSPGDFYHTVPVEGQMCDSMYLLRLEVRPTSVGDTVARGCDNFVWRGVNYTTDTVVVSDPQGYNTVGCDTSTRLHLSIFPTYYITDTIVYCPYQPFIYQGVDYGGPTVIDSVMQSVEGCDSVLYVCLVKRDPFYSVNVYYSTDSIFWNPADSLLVACRPVDLQVYDSTPTSTSWQWQAILRDTVILSDSSSIHLLPYDFDQSPRSGLATWLRLETVDTLGCHDTLAWPVVVLESPVVDFKWSPDFPSVHQPEAQFYNLSTPEPLVYLWSFQRPDGASDDTSSARSPYHSWGEPGSDIAGEYTVSLQAGIEHHIAEFQVDSVGWILRRLQETLTSDVFGPIDKTCYNTLRRNVVIVNDYLQFPNLVTPNSDGINDTWRVVNLIEWGEYSMNELWIYDRTGALVYHVKNISRDDQFWDPNQTRSPDGTYYYRFSGKGEYGLVRRNGTIEVVRKEGGNE